MAWTLATVAAPAPALPEPAPISEPGEGQIAIERIAEHPFQDGVMQVRIESRVIIRIPRTEPGRRALSAAPVPAPPRPKAAPTPLKFKEKKFGDCLIVERLVGMRVSTDDSIDMFTVDRQQVRAHLDNACSSREFYSGLYIERASDGKICANRDMLHSRSGSKCSIDRLRLLVPDED